MDIYTIYGSVLKIKGTPCMHNLVAVCTHLGKINKKKYLSVTIE